MTLETTAAAVGDITEAEFRAQFERFRAAGEGSGRQFAVEWADRLPRLSDRTSSTGFDRHYVYHTAWAARLLARLRPAEHVDIASSLYFATIASAFVPVRYYEYRPVDLGLANLTCDHADLTALPFDDGSVCSLSCMHVVEHVGLGRYGDEIDFDADLKAMAELRRVLAPGGDLLFVVPVGRPRVQFNAHRIYAFDQVREAFADLELMEFALVPDRSDEFGLIGHATKERADRQRYGCGCFWFRDGGRGPRA
jgi:SAM-dependent methyltransferase